MKVSDGRRMLATHGLNLFSVLGLDRLPAAFQSALGEAGIDSGDYARLIMIGHGGRLLWRRLQQEGMGSTDPVDDYSLRCAERFVGEYLGGCAHRVLYPGNLPIPLQQLGRIAGWHHDSPLGIGINALYGPWFGYRVIMLVKADVPVSTASAGPSPCTGCRDKPCIGACPVGALSADAPPDVGGCVDYRMGNDSVCAYTCLARLACPEGADHRYDEDQIRYFYGRSLDSIRRYRQE